jgi:hypothetical protein
MQAAALKKIKLPQTRPNIFVAGITSCMALLLLLLLLLLLCGRGGCLMDLMTLEPFPDPN